VTNSLVLPEIVRRALWHDTAGLVVSLNNSSLPNLSARSEQQPAYFDDSEIWKAFLPKNGVFNAPLFDRLDLTGPQILEAVVQLGPETFSLPDTIIGSWSRLENALLDVADNSLGTHPKSSSIPTITWPRSPHEYGYRRTHRSPIIVLRSAMRSQNAFHSLCAVVTFILSLWTKPDSLCVAPFRSAFWGLTHRINVPVQPSWLDQFSQSLVCNITLAFRTGCFINPYTSCWGPWLPNFVRAGVQVWVVWGLDVINTKPSFLSQPTKFYENFLPTLELIKSTKSQFQETQALQLPSPFLPAGFPISFTPSITSSPLRPPFVADVFPIQHTIEPSTTSVEQDPSPAPSVVSQSLPSAAEPPQPLPNSRQRRGETLPDFLNRLAEGKRTRETSETSTATQSRIDREISAARKGYSKSCTVFEWKEIQGHYLRVKVDRIEVPGLWNEYPASRRVYHSHINEWDLCPPIPPFSETLTQQDIAEIEQYDDEIDAFDNASTTLKPPSDQFAAQHAGQMDELASQVDSSQPVPLQFDIVEHLKDRYGFDVHRRPSWTPNLHGQQVAEVDVAKGRFLFQTASHPTLLAPAIENFYNVLANKGVRVHNLSSAWDLGHLQLEIPGLRLSLGTDVNDDRMYMISHTTAVHGSWNVCLHNPTTVLQIYRNRWTTLDTIVEELVFRGIPFNTGVPDPSPKIIQKGYESKGLGLRPVGYTPRSHDYNAYVAARTDVLRSHLGRAALLKGGLISRLARDTVGVSDVLSGPDPSTSAMLGTVDGVELVDDELSDYLLDLISGVYYVETARDANIHQHLSWWPKDGVWHNSGFFSEQWSADAETWYQSRLKSIESGSARLFNSTEWKSNLRRYKTHTRSMLTLNDQLSEAVIDRHFSYASFWNL
jgi:hypothetical protein